MHFVRNGQTEGRTMLKYIGKRVLQLIPVLIGITFLSFAMMRLASSLYFCASNLLIVK